MSESLSDRLRRLRTEKGYSVKEVAEAIGVPVTTYREWEHGRKIVGEPYLALSKVFEVSLYELLTGEKTSGFDLSRSFSVIEAELRKMKENLVSR